MNQLHIEMHDDCVYLYEWGLPYKVKPAIECALLKSKWPQGGTVLKRLFLISAHFSERFPDFFSKIIKYNHKQTVVNMYR